MYTYKKGEGKERKERAIKKKCSEDSDSTPRLFLLVFRHY